MVKQLTITRTVEDIDFNYRTMVNVKFQNEDWTPVTLEDVGGILKSMGMIDGYESDTQRVWIEEEIDLQYNREYNYYEPVFRSRSQDIRDFMRDLDWKDYNRIFAGVGF